MQVSVIGLGQVGSETFKAIELARVPDIACTGVDIEYATRKTFHEAGYRVAERAPRSDAYIIAVYTTQQVFGVLESLDLTAWPHPLVSIESTLDPRALPDLRAWATDRHVRLVTFPHRFNPGDPEHHVFNLERVLGGINAEAAKRGIEFYSRFMDPQRIYETTFEIAALCKVAENAYRFMEIALAQELRRSCDLAGIDFEELRKAVNTKWNTDIKEARDGVKGKCLPKDMQLLMDFFWDNKALKLLWQLNEEYARKYGTVPAKAR